MLASIFGDSSDSEREGPQQTIPKKHHRLDQNGPGEGDVIGYTEAPSSSGVPRNHVAVNPLSVQLGNSTNSGTTGLQPTSGPTEKPSPLFHDFSKWAPLDLSTPAPLSSFTPLDPQPMAEFWNNCDSGVIFTSLENLTAGWDGWPSGRFALDLTHKEFLSTKGLQVHWATRNSGGDRIGQCNSVNIYGGKISTKQCLGVIHCTNPECKIVTWPHVNSKAYLICWDQVGNDSSTTKYRYINGDAHTHSCLPHAIHFSKQEEEKFQSLVNRHPSLGPAALVVGPKTLDGFGPGAADIAQAARNPDFFSAWQQQHPGVVRTCITNDKVSVLSIQTEWMRDRMLPDTVTAGPLNGMVSDGAHGYWIDSSLVLIITSTFSEKLKVWVPNLFTYSDGTSAEHYRYHFKAVFESIAEVANLKG
ncbi:hypothetical protein GYMLUDRAFT_249999 [Collybiopsis luxurians FD-317 M1]|uniref:Unplaced genomic scaffold GYMLUscaffold_75, whole genome shotgun sequence n=1 Tax=Collybiopsis luxurians FD-317 M1 TaxID=944289 RepID=A0A0D0BGH9_9AGAR|nr:hypothetical protein GYMLUDRAFT_249999 [Collybiopsis luxurians FD-317 M1]